MKEKFEKLNILRTTEAERLLDDYKRTFAAQKQSTFQFLSVHTNTHNRRRSIDFRVKGGE